MAHNIRKMEVQIPVNIFEEAGKFVVFSPVIDLSSCGDSEEQARKKFTEAAAIFFDEISRMGTIDDVLTECGWQKVAHKSSWSPPVYKSSTEVVNIPEKVC
ncbi:MAG: hypothetical protein WC369_08710 [Dehalococcoidales bacterium]|jgi:hypothetical protein